MKSASSFVLNTSALALSIEMVPWDSEAFGFPAAQINAINVVKAELAKADFQLGRNWLDENSVRMVSCRIPHHHFAESIFLEGEGFRFIEMVLHPRIESLDTLALAEEGLSIRPAEACDLPKLTEIAESAFYNERFHVDPRIDSERANVRYGNWVRNSLLHPRQTLLKVTNEDEIVALFVVEVLDSGSAYWHLTAVAPHLQGQGFGWRAWRSMMHHHKRSGIKSVETTISARNTRVLNLYARLGFRFLPPETTFHYIR